ncbi:hypothetical protein BGZ63DRAFT_372180 [Mariannaea sp. PMI_226]|nr:hypothetical protein BGZ63DRAFT_372180 [Mariannaea sp. PMI_226]
MQFINPHANLFEALTEFYTLLVQLALVPASMLRFPDPVNVSDDFNTEAALEAGFSAEAARLIATLPYVDLSIDSQEEDIEINGFFEIMPSTQFVDLDRSGDMVAFEWLRDIDQDPYDDRKVPGTVIRLSVSDIYGTVLLYDTETRLMREWQPFQGEDDFGYDSVPQKLPTEVLRPWIEKFRKLEYLSDSRQMHFYLENDPVPWGTPSEQELARLKAADDYRIAILGLQDIYRECGWDTESKTQDGFDKERFVKMRKRYFNAVLEPHSHFVDAFVGGSHPKWEPAVEPWRDEL